MYPQHDQGAAVQPLHDAISLVRQQVREAHQLLERSLPAAAGHGDVLSLPDSRGRGRYFHTVCIEDLTINLVLCNRPPVFVRLGLDGLFLSANRARLRRYARTVQAATDAFLAELRSEDLARPIELSSRLGTHSLAWVLDDFILREYASTCEEIRRSTALERRTERTFGRLRAGPQPLPFAAPLRRCSERSSKG